YPLADSRVKGPNDDIAPEPGRSGGTVSVFSVDPCVTFMVESLTVANGNNAVGSGGGAIHSNFPGALTVMNSTFSGSTSGSTSGGAFGGGAIYSLSALTV